MSTILVSTNTRQGLLRFAAEKAAARLASSAADRAAALRAEATELEEKGKRAMSESSKIWTAARKSRARAKDLLAEANRIDPIN